MIDVLILTKDASGAVEAMELSDVPELGELQALEAEFLNCSPRTTAPTWHLRWIPAVRRAC
jgi:hypothetical protein